MSMARLLIASALVCRCLAGCSAVASSEVEGDPLAVAPDDFALEVAVLRGEPAEGTEVGGVEAGAGGGSGAHLRPGRFILFADGSLHYGVSDEAEAAIDALDENGRAASRSPRPAREGNWLPALTRVLDRGQVAAIWSRAQQLGFVEAGEREAGGALNIATIEPELNEVVHVLTFRAHGRRWTVVDRTSADQQPDAAVSEFVRLLAQLAWASDQPHLQPHIEPKRYDFGPDPYARYRK